MKKIYITLVIIAGLTSAWASAPASPVISVEHRAWINSQYNNVKGKIFDVFVNNKDDILDTPEKLTVNNCEDYIQLLASNLVMGNLKNQALALNDAFSILTTAADEAPTDPVYQAMYPDNKKQISVGACLIKIPTERILDQVMQEMGIIGAPNSTGFTELSPMRNRSVQPPQ